MAATVIIEHGNFETGARLAGAVAQSLEQFEPVRLVVRDDGPLLPWLAEHVHGRIDICNRGNFPYGAPFAERIRAAASFLESDSSDIAYVFGLGASDFAFAAHSQDRRVVLQAYQTAPQIERLLAGDQAKLDCAWFCHALVTSEHFDREKLSRLFGRTPVRVCNVGPRIDVEWLNRASAGVPPAAVNSNSEPLEWDSQFVVGGGGTSGEHAAFFTSLARECPDVAFVWLGETHNANNASIDAPKNLYGAVHRGDILVCLASLGAYVMCGPDGNPLMPTAAAAMGKPVIGFPTAGATELLGHYGILCHGNPDPAPVSDIIRKIAAQTPLAPVHTNDWLGRQLDVDGCVNTILQTMADVRLMELR